LPSSLDGAVAITSILSLCRLVMSTDFLAHKIIPSHWPNQSIPSIISILLDLRTTRSAWKSIHQILTLTCGHPYVDFISPFGEPISKCVFIKLIGILCFVANCSVLNVMLWNQIKPLLAQSWLETFPVQQQECLELVQLSRVSLCHAHNFVHPCWSENVHFHDMSEMMVVQTFDHCLSGESRCYDLGRCWHSVPTPY
jgi:hypothetical protein